LSVQLIRPRIDRREVVLLVSPPDPTPGESKLSETAAVICRLMSNAVIDLAAPRHRQHQDDSEKDEEPSLRVNLGPWSSRIPSCVAVRVHAEP
jgi:hypothetical protein